jgi:hypothetical protein
MNLNVRPWAGLDGPSLASCAAGLQLMPENIPYLTRAQRLAAIGASLPAAPDIRLLSPSGLRALLKDPLISGENVRQQEDTYEDVYVEEVVFHGGPRLVLQGLTNHSAHTARTLLNAIFRLTGNGLPQAYVDDARLLVTAVLALSHAVCGRAGLKRGTMAAQAQRREPLVPGAARLGELRDAVTFTPEDLASLLPYGGMQALHDWINDVGAHRVDLDSSVTDDGLILRPLLRHGPTLIVANPGELASALRHHLIVMAASYECRDELADAFRRTAAALTEELLTQIGALPRTPVAEAGPLVLRQAFDGASDTIVDVGVLTDDLSGYDPAEPFGSWDIPNAGQPLQDCLDPAGTPDQDDERTLRLAVTDDFARTQMIGLEKFRRPGPMLAVPLDELQVMIDLDAKDPLFLWRFARANERFHEISRVWSWSVLDSYSIYRDHDCSFYLDDDRSAIMVTVSVGSGANLRSEVQRRHDRHHIPGPDGDKYVEVISMYGTDTAPIYYIHPRHGHVALAVELPEATAWVLYAGDLSEAVSGLLFTLLEAVAYWIWQLASARPGILDNASGPDRRLRVAVVPDDARRWDQVLTGQSQEDAVALEENPDVAVAPWVAASRDSPGKLTVTILAEHARVLLSGTNLADRQLVAALAGALIPSDDREQVDTVTSRVAPRGPKRMILVWLSGDVLLVPTDVPVRTVQPAVTATLLDDLGHWLAGTGLSTGPIGSDARTGLLNQAVGYYYQRLEKTIADLSPDGLMAFMVSQDEALLQDGAKRAQRLPSQLACFGAESIPAHDLRTQDSKNIQAAVASRFLIEYTAATPPTGSTRINLMIYDELLALADELIARATLSDAIHYGFSQVELSLLPSGRLGVSLGDRYVAGTKATAAAEAEARHALALGPATASGAPQPTAGTEQRSANAATRVRVDDAMRAEFGFTLTQAIDGLSDLAAESAARGRGPTSEPVAQVRSRLQNLPGWDEETARAFLSKLTLRPRAKFMSPGIDACPWRFNRDLSYIRRPLIEITGPDGGALLMWSSRRAWFAARYWTELIFTGRLKGATQPMKTLMGTIRQDQNKAFEREVKAVLAQSGFPFAGTGVKRICAQRLLSTDGADLGDIDAIALDPATKTIIVAEAKDFELARTPAELANEAEDLLTGDKSAVRKLGRRAAWVQSHVALALRHFGVAATETGWHVVPVIVTSRHLISPRVLEVSVPVVARADLPSWASQQGSRQRRRPQRR